MTDNDFFDVLYRPDHSELRILHKDRIRLKALTKKSFDGVWSNDGVTHPEHVCGYQFGAFIEVHVKRGIVTVEEFEKGAIARERAFSLSYGK